MNSEDETCPVCFESLTTSSEWPPLRCTNHHKLCRTCAAKMEGGRYSDDPCSDGCCSFHYKCPICRIETCFERVMDYMDPPAGVRCVDANGEPIAVGDRVRLKNVLLDGKSSFTVESIDYHGFLDGYNQLWGADGYMLDGEGVNWNAVFCVKMRDEPDNEPDSEAGNESECESRATDDTPCPYCGYSDADHGCQCELERQGNGPD